MVTDSATLEIVLEIVIPIAKAAEEGACSHFSCLSSRLIYLLKTLLQVCLHKFVGTYVLFLVPSWLCNGNM